MIMVIMVMTVMIMMTVIIVMMVMIVMMFGVKEILVSMMKIRAYEAMMKFIMTIILVKMILIKTCMSLKLKCQ